MQTLLQTRKIEDEERREAILGVMADKYCRSIIDTTMEKPKSAMEIASDTAIPISTIYRRLQTLHDCKILSISGMISDEGKKFFLYRSKIRALSAVFRGNYIELEIVPNTSSAAN